MDAEQPRTGAIRAILAICATAFLALPEIVRKWPLPFVGVAVVGGFLIGRGW